MRTLFNYSDARTMCHKLKSDDSLAVLQVAGELSRLVKPSDVLVPVPGHSGQASYMLAVADRLHELTGCEVADVIRGAQRPTWYSAKMNGRQMDFGLWLEKQPRGHIVLLDNVIDTGRTMKECLRLLPNAEIMAYALVSK